jgi:carbon-monoxide dehydrogenase small subunit
MEWKEVLRIRVNGDSHEVAAAPNRTLLDLIRDDLGLTGTKRGCDDASCGACTVLADGRPALSCILLALTVEGAEVVTIEGVAGDGRLSPLQEALVAGGGLQCGYCTPGVVLAARALLERTPCPTEDEVREGISNNLCRCTGYGRIIEAVRKGACHQPAER